MWRTKVVGDHNLLNLTCKVKNRVPRERAYAKNVDYLDCLDRIYESGSFTTSRKWLISVDFFQNFTV